MEKKWYAVYTKPRWEKKVDKVLNEKGTESYCPLQKIQRQWSDRKKIVEEPLFKSYVFVRIADEEQTELRMVNGVVNFVYWMGKPAIIKDKEIETIKKFLNDYQDIHVEPLDIHPNSKVHINSGALMDKEATVLSVTRNTVKVVIESIGLSLVANIDKSKVSVVRK
jgi:transcription antitermination factor NusG